MPDPFELRGFTGWLVAGGAEVVRTANPWEVLRVRTSLGTLVAYTNAKSNQKWPPQLAALRRAFEGNEPVPDLAPQAPIRGLLVTIFADASLDHRTRAAGWGAWIKRHGQDGVTCSGVITTAVAQSGEAELCALANALSAAREKDLLAEAAAVMLESDSFHALAVIRTLIPRVEDRPADRGIRIPILRKARPTDAERVAIDSIAETAIATGIRVLTRHVHGHKTGGGRQWVNRECDRLARASMRARQTEILGAANG